MARKNRRVNRRKKQIEVVKTSTGMEEFARSTADLVTKLCKLAHDSEMTDVAFTSFRHQIQEVLDQDQRDLIEMLCDQVSGDLQSLRGSEKSGSNGADDADPDPGTTAEPEPPPKEEEKPKEEAVTDTPPSEDSVSLLGFGIRFSQSPTKHAIDDCLMNPILVTNNPGDFLSKRDIATEIGSHPDTVRKRIAEIKKNSHSCKAEVPSSDVLKELYKYKIGNTGTGVGIYLLEEISPNNSRVYRIQTKTSE